jgi:hypothetical protein
MVDKMRLSREKKKKFGDSYGEKLIGQLGLIAAWENEFPYIT